MGIFSQNSGFVKFVNRALDVLWLNILWLLFCLPIITIGASTCAAYSVTLKMVDEEEGYVGRQFVKAFKDNFKQGTIMWLITAPSIYLDFLMFQFIVKGEDVNFLVIIGAIVYTALVVISNLYTYPLIARYENKLINMIKNSMAISVRYFGKTVFLCLLIVIEVLLILWNKWTLFVGILIGPEFIIYTVSGISKRIFQKIEAGNDSNSGTINQ
ncbi:MAG: YesL family protein [Treponema sp.]|nr:YesL family protein [Treponema sp.]